MSKIGILGAGTWGTALGCVLCNAGHDVTVWSASEEKARELSACRRHRNLPDTVIPTGVCFTGDMRHACEGRELLFCAVSSVYVRSATALAAPYITPSQIIVSVAKGIEAETLFTLSESIADEIARTRKYDHTRIAALSGPTHAEEVVRDLPTTAVSASRDRAAAEAVQDVFDGTCMRVYTNTDIRGVEICGALKNIIALAAGISAGLGYGDNTKAAIITRGLAEMKRLGTAMGCDEDTFSGLAGMGDLIVTATSRHSRNNRCGILIGQGCRARDAVAQVGMVVEGVNAIPAAVRLADTYRVDMPIIRAVEAIVDGKTSASEAVEMLMARKKKPEAM